MTHPARMFIVGFPRSGTTLLQVLLAAHPDVYSLPETFFFHRVFGASARRPWVGQCRWEASDGPGGAKTEIGSLRSRFPQTRGQLCRRYVAALDRAARAEGRTAWLEKTPIHLRYVDHIDRFVNHAHVIHLVREGVPAVASLVTVTRDHPDAWGGSRSVDKCLQRWREDLRRSARCIGRPRHHFVSYQRLVADTAGVLSRLLGALRLRFDETQTVNRMLADYSGKLAGVVSNEEWKTDVSTPITNRNAAHVGHVFSDSDRELVTATVAQDDVLFGSFPFV